MEIIEQVLNMPEEELEGFVRDRINYLEEEIDEKINIGFLTNDNYKKEIFLSEHERWTRGLKIHFLHDDYIPKGSRISYSYTGDGSYHYRNSGLYYYMDTDDYILEFCKYVRSINVEDLEDFLIEIHDFLRLYFGEIARFDRDAMFRLVIDVNGDFFPGTEHGLSWFKKNGNAECSEYAALAQNILSFFDIGSLLVFGGIKTDGEIEDHSYNIVRCFEDDDVLLVDFSKCIDIIDINFNVIGTYPFIGKINGFGEELFNDLVDGNSRIVYDNYGYMAFRDNLKRLRYYSQREYHVGVKYRSSKDLKKTITIE